MAETSNNKHPLQKNKKSLSTRMPRIGRVLFGEDSSAIHCTVKNLTKDSAIVTMTGWLCLPSDFTLFVEPDSLKANCRVIHRKGSNIQVEFTQVEEGVRYRAA